MAETVRYNIVLNDEVSAKLAKIEAKFASLEGKISDSNNSMKSMGKTMQVGVLLNAANMAIQAGQAIWGMASAYVKSAGDIQANTNALKVASKSEEEFAANKEFLSKVSDKYSLSLESSLNGLKMWTAATMNTNLRGEEARKMFENVSSASAAMGLNAETTEGVFLALSQMMSKGKVSAEELRGQLGERLPGAFGLMAKSMGVTEAKLNDMMQKGEVISEQVLPKFADLLAKEFPFSAETAKTSINGLMTKLDNMRANFLINATPAIATFLQKVIQMSEYIQSINFEPLLDAFRNYAAVFEPIISAFGRLFGSAESGNTAILLLATAFHTLMIPLRITVGMLTQIVLVLETIIQLSQALINGEFSKMGDILGDQATRIKDNFLGTFSSIKQGYEDIWTDSKGPAANALSSLTGDKKQSNLLDTPTSSAVAASKGNNKTVKEANANISGSAPKNININIGSLIGQNTNMFERSEDQETLSKFTKKLLQALQQEVANVNIQYM